MGNSRVRSDPLMSLMGFGGMDFDSDKAYRDVAWLGDTDNGCPALVESLGWKEELEELVQREHAAIDSRGEGRDGGNPKKSLGDKGKVPKDHDKPQGDKDKAQSDPKKLPGGSEDAPNSTGGAMKNEMVMEEFLDCVVTGELS